MKISFLRIFGNFLFLEVFLVKKEEEEEVNLRRRKFSRIKKIVIAIMITKNRTAFEKYHFHELLGLKISIFEIFFFLKYF